MISNQKRSSQTCRLAQSLSGRLITDDEINFGLPKVLFSYKVLFQLYCLCGGFEFVEPFLWMERKFERDKEFAFSTLTLGPWK